MNLDATSDKLVARSDSGFRVSPSANGTQKVELWDVMPVGWLGRFTRAAASISLNIVSGVARRDEHTRWSAEFEVRGAIDGDVEQIDFLALAREPSESFTLPALELRSFELTRSDDERRALVLTIRARDKMGFLASLLEHLAGLVLFPEEIRIDTFRNEAHDILWLSSVGGQSPAPETEAALRASLVACSRRRASLFPGT